MPELAEGQNARIKCHYYTKHFTILIDTSGKNIPKYLFFRCFLSFVGVYSITSQRHGGDEVDKTNQSERDIMTGKRIIAYKHSL